jgi:predicted RNase H-like HicB family nuclease
MKSITIKFALPVSILKEGNSFIAYTPALDLSTVGDTFEDARKNFDEAVNVFFEELLEMGTADEVLEGLGWQKQNDTFLPPVVVANQTESFSIPLAN